jgi:hypothetical protein
VKTLFKACSALLPVLLVTAHAPLDAKKKKQAAPVAAAPVYAPLPAMWFGLPTSKQGATTLVDILRRSSVEGFAEGPSLAVQAEAAIARAASGNPADVTAADNFLSDAWVKYVQFINLPVPDTQYGEAWMRPIMPSRAAILAQTRAAPLIDAHLKKISNVNSTYVAMRDAALAQTGLAGADLDKVRASLQRARAIPSAGRFILVDGASARLTMYENGHPVDSMKVVVGMPEFPTPMIVSNIYYATMNPYWHVPPHLVRKTVAPNARSQGAKYLKSRGYEVVDSWSQTANVLPASSVDWAAAAAGTAEPKIRQLPGKDNSMGKMKFNFPNTEGIYLHDTPLTEYFKRTNRALSNGCIRLEDAPRLARWLFAGQPVPNVTVPEQHMPIPARVPVVVTYLTAQLDSTGKLAFHNDVYGRDVMSPQRVASTN